MAIVSNDEMLTYLGISNPYFIITSVNDALVFRVSVTNTPIDIPDGTYGATELCAAVKSCLDTAFTPLTFTVSYDSDTCKFTITPSAGTLAYINTGSDGGYTLGFTQDHTAATSLTSDIEAGAQNSVLLSIRDAAEEYVQNVYCRRNFELTSYKERYDGKGTRTLTLKNAPVVSLTKLSIGTVDVVKVCNTSSYTSSTVSVSSTGLNLMKDDVVDSSIVFLTYDTIGKVVNAINALGNSWSASSLCSIYDNYKSTELIDMMGANCIDSNWVYLQVPDKPEDTFDVYAERGQIVLPGRSDSLLRDARAMAVNYEDNPHWDSYCNLVFPTGNRNIFVNYTAGYTSANMPADLKLAIKIITKTLYGATMQDTFGVRNYSVDRISMTLDDSEIPMEAKTILNRYRKTLI